MRTRLFVYSTFLVLLVACSHAARPVAAPSSATTTTTATVEAAPTRICARSIEVKWAGVDGAAADMHRTEEQARIRAEMIANSAADPESHFEELAHSYGDASVLGDTCAGGKLVTRGDGTYDAVVEDSAFALSINEVSAPVRTPHGFVIVMRGAEAESVPEEIGARHILISYAGADNAGEGVTRTREEARVLAEQVAAEARAPGANWDELVSRHSDEPQAAERHGDLGRFGHGRMVRAFERAAFDLDVGEISEVVETGFGFHIIHRYE